MREIELIEFFADYRRAQANRSAEQIAEGRVLGKTLSFLGSPGYPYFLAAFVLTLNAFF